MALCSKWRRFMCYGWGKRHINFQWQLAVDFDPDCREIYAVTHKVDFTWPRFNEGRHEQGKGRRWTHTRSTLIWQWFNIFDRLTTKTVNDGRILCKVRTSPLQLAIDFQEKDKHRGPKGKGGEGKRTIQKWRFHWILDYTTPRRRANTPGITT